MFTVCAFTVVQTCNSLSLVTGGSDDVNNLHKQNKLVGLLEEQHDYEYDLIVLGGGSGGLSAAKVRDNIF